MNEEYDVLLVWDQFGDPPKAYVVLRRDRERVLRELELLGEAFLRRHDCLGELYERIQPASYALAELVMPPKEARAPGRAAWTQDGQAGKP